MAHYIRQINGETNYLFETFPNFQVRVPGPGDGGQQRDGLAFGERVLPPLGGGGAAPGIRGEICLRFLNGGNESIRYY